MKNKCCFTGKQIPFSELRRQLEYARTVSNDIEKVYACRMPKITELLDEYSAVRSRVQMLQDFLFQAVLWCDTIMPEEEYNLIEDEKEKEENKEEE